MNDQCDFNGGIDIDLEFMIEVGPGPGGITRQLFEHGAARVAAIEKDIRLFPALQVNQYD